MSKLWGIRHVRYFVLLVRWNIWWNSTGRYLGAFPNESDAKYLDAVWEGRA